MGEEIGSEMALRTFGHLVSLLSNLCCRVCDFCSCRPNMPLFPHFYQLGLVQTCCHLFCTCWKTHVCIPSLSVHQLRYGEPTLRRAVPLALALISVSNPRLNILDTLSKFSHDADPEVSHNSIFAMGMVGSGKKRNPVLPWLCERRGFRNIGLLITFSFPPRHKQCPSGSHAEAASPVPR